MTQSVVTETNLTNVPLFNRGKVRDLYDLDDKLLMISTDRISAFDYVLPDGIPCKGNVLDSVIGVLVQSHEFNRGQSPDYYRCRRIS